MKGVMQYIIAVVLVAVGIALLLRPSHPAAAPSREVRPSVGSQLQTAQRPLYTGILRTV